MNLLWYLIITQLSFVLCYAQDLVTWHTNWKIVPYQKPYSLREHALRPDFFGLGSFAWRPHVVITSEKAYEVGRYFKNQEVLRDGEQIEVPVYKELSVLQCLEYLENNPGLVALGTKFLKMLVTDSAYQLPVTSPQPDPIQQVEKKDAVYKPLAQNIMWGLYAVAHEKKQLFEEGTFVVDDPYGFIFKILKNAGAYKRISSHFKAYRGEHFGLDVEGLPCKKRHILFGTLPNNKIFIKPENYGLSTWWDTVHHGMEFIVAQLRKIEATRNYFGLTSDDANVYRKERVEANVLDKFKHVLQQLELDMDIRNAHLKLAKDFGLQKMVHILRAYNNQQPAQEFFTHLVQVVDNPDERTGREVIVKIEDLSR